MKPPYSFRLPITLTLVGYTTGVLGLSVCRQAGMLRGGTHLPATARAKKFDRETSSGEVVLSTIHTDRCEDSDLEAGEAPSQSNLEQTLTRPTSPTHRSTPTARQAAGSYGHHADRRAGSKQSGKQASKTTRSRAGRRLGWYLDEGMSSQVHEYLLIAATALAPVLANYSLLLNSVGVYQLAKVLVTPAIVTLESVRGARPLSRERKTCLVVVSLGVAIVTVSDVSVNIVGLAVAGLNIGVAGYYKVEWSHTCKDRGLSSLQLMSIVMPRATVLLACLAVLIEGPQLASYAFDASVVYLLVLCGITAFFTSWTGYVVISKLSALTHQLLGQAKTCLILVAGHMFFGSRLTSTQFAGATLAMSAMVAYTYFTLTSPAVGPSKGRKGPPVTLSVSQLGRGGGFLSRAFVI